MSLGLPFLLDPGEQHTTAASASTNATAALWTSGSGSAGTSYGRNGGVGYQDLSVVYAVPAGTVRLGMGMGYRCVTANVSAGLLIVFRDVSGNRCATLEYFNGNLKFTPLSGAAATVNGAFGTGVWVDLECQAYVNGAAGTFDVVLNGANVMSLNNVNLGSVSINNIWLLTSNGGTGQADDIYAYDCTSRTGTAGAGTFEHYSPKRIQWRPATGAGTGTVGTWTQVGGTGGSPYTAVNESPPNGDTSYVADATPGDIISFTHAALDAGTTGVVAVGVFVVAERDDAAARQIATGLRTSSTNAFGAAVGTPASYGATLQTYGTDGSGAALTPTGVNATETLVKVAA